MASIWACSAIKGVFRKFWHAYVCMCIKVCVYIYIYIYTYVHVKKESERTMARS